MTDRIDIHDEIFALCAKLGLEPENVAEIVFRPADVTATVYLLNEHGRMFVAADGGVAQRELYYKVKT